LSDYHHYLVAQGFEPDKDSAGQRVFSRERACAMPEPHTKARFTGRAAARLIRANVGRPWVLYVSFLEPHPPYLGPLDDHYPPQAVPDGPAYLQPPPDDAPLVNRLLSENHRAIADEDGQDLRTKAGWLKTRAKYLGNVTLVDRAVGDILAALDESGQADNTVVVFTSDHGDQMGDHGLLGKCVMYEESVRVPLIVRAPWLAQTARRVAQPVSLVDLVPTLLDLLDQPVPAYLQGRSRAAYLNGRPPPNEDVFIEWNEDNARGPSKIKQPLTGTERARVFSPWRSIISPDGWKLNLSPEGEGELYHLAADPFEQHNLFANPAHHTRRRDLGDRLRAWQAAQRDDLALPGD
jgi:arylsulfatase A-like enzyme